MASDVSAPASTKNTLEIAAAAFKGRDDVVEARRFRVLGDGVDLGAMRGQRPVEGRTEMLGRDRSERWQTEGAGPFSKQRIVGSVRAGHAAYLGAIPAAGEPPSDELLGLDPTAGFGFVAASHRSLPWPSPAAALSGCTS